MTPKFKTKTGQLTRYALACGYVERRALVGFNNAEVELSLDGTLHVKAFDYANHARLLWEIPATLKATRKLYNKAETIIHNPNAN